MITCYEKVEKKYKHDVMTYGFKSGNVSDRANTVMSVLIIISKRKKMIVMKKMTG